MRILIFEPGKNPRAADIPHSLDKMQAIVGGTIQAVNPWSERAALVCDDEGLLKDYPFNRKIGEHTIFGTFFICGLGEEDFTDLPDDLAEKYEQMFHHPQAFARVNEDIIVIGADGSLTRVAL